MASKTRKAMREKRSTLQPDKDDFETETIQTSNSKPPQGLEPNRDVSDQLRSKSRLTTYFNTHRSSPHMPELDTLASTALSYTKSNERDRVYDTDVERMCNNVRVRFLCFPHEPLPAGYNSSVLRILECFHKKSVENIELQKTIDLEMEAYKAEIEKFRKSYVAWEEERELLRANAVIGKERVCKSTSKTSGADATKAESQVDGLRDFNQVEKPHNSDAPVCIKPTHNFGASLSGMEIHLRPIGDISKIITGVKHQYSHESLPGSGNSGSTMNGDLLPDEEEFEWAQDREIASRLTEWLAARTGDIPETVYPQVMSMLSKEYASNAHSSTSEGVEQVPPRISQTSASPELIDSTHIEPRKKEQYTSADTVLRSGKLTIGGRERRAFSFLPGDDRYGSQAGQGRQRLPKAEHDVDVLLSRELKFGSIAPRGRQDIPHREDSNRSVQTAIRDESGCNSTEPDGFPGAHRSSARRRRTMEKVGNWLHSKDHISSR